MHSSLTQFNVLSSGYYGISLCVIQSIIIIFFPNLWDMWEYVGLALESIDPKTEFNSQPPYYKEDKKQPA